MHTWFTRACVTAGTVTAVGLLAAGTASAHVTPPMPGWTATITTDPTTSVTWMAMPGKSIGDNQFGSAGTDTTTRWLGGIGLVLGALGLVLCGGAALRSRGRS